ncbi:Programmed cell death 6-interacting protein [Gryllus bimaculatus]|nr:Programmed cell death 6-interacting protein [Gryllus bimaculatus]
MADLLAVPLKKPSDVDVVKPLKNLIASTYSTADKPEDYSEQINDFFKLRTNAIWRAFEKYESSLEVIYSYYDQLVALETKIPPQEVQIPFKWKDAFDKGSLFGGRMSLTVSSLAYEKVCVLFNIAALQSAVASSQSVENDDSLKLAAKLFQQAAGVLNHLKGTVMLAIQQEPTPDLNPETLGALSALMLAQGQEIFVLKAINDHMKDTIVAKLCSQCEELYAEVLKVFQKDNLRPLWDKDWIPTVAGKQAGYRALTHYYQSLVCKANKEVGEEIARLEHSLELFKAAQQRSGKPTCFQEYATKAQRNLNEAKKDNDFIYHERIPDVKSLSAVPKAQLAKALPLPEHFSQNFKDLFDNLFQSLCTKLGSPMMFAKMNYEFVLASLNLPAALEDQSGEGLPQSLLDKAESVRSRGGVQKLQQIITELPELLQRNKDILDEADRLLQEEKSSDDQLREQFKERWSRTPSERLTESFRTNLAKYREIINNAVSADAVVRNKFDAHKRGMELLCGSPDQLQAAVPSAGPGGAVRDSAAVQELRRLMEEVETLKAERDVIESELKSATVDMQAQFLSALGQDGAINEQALSVETLGRVYGPLQKQVAESVQRQETLVANIQSANSEFCKEKSNAGGAARREAVLKELAAAHDAFIELLNNLQEGTNFYNNLTELLVVFQNKISDFCFARRTEKEELLKDLTQEATRGIGAAPTPPAHHIPGPSGITPDARKAPPPRPPPPAAPASVVQPEVPAASAAAAAPPYPLYPGAMPLPYGAAPGAPYPTYVPPPMPAGYNPYGGAPMPYPQQGYYPFPQPQAWPAGYPYPQQQQQPPQGSRPW